MSVYEKVRLDLRRSMFERKDDLKYATRMILGEVGRMDLKAGEFPSDEQMISLIKKMIKSEKECIEMGKGDQDYIDILSRYVPKNLSESDVLEWVKNNENIVANLKNKNQVIGLLKKEFGDIIDGKMIANMVKENRF